MPEYSRTLISTRSPFEAEMSYSRAVVQGGWCFVSGVTGYDYQSMKMPKTVDAQTRNCFKTIKKVLNEAGFEMKDIVRVQYMVVSAGLVKDLAPALSDFLGDIRPAATMIIAGLIKPEMLVEIEVTAFVG